jgi:hypothetical protein
LTAVTLSEHAAWSRLAAVVEEKVDGANAGISFEDGALVLQSRGHILSGGPREVQFNLLKQWAREYEYALRDVLGDRYVAFGEWCYAKNRIFYDALPAYFIEFDIFDKTTSNFLSTPRRRILLAGSPLASVAVIHTGVFGKVNSFGLFIGPSRYKTDRWREMFDALMIGGLARHYDASETDDSRLMEGIYVKVEDDEKVVGRMKLPRIEFEKVRTDDAKWLRRPLFPNQCSLRTSGAVTVDAHNVDGK